MYIHSSTWETLFCLWGLFGKESKKFLLCSFSSLVPFLWMVNSLLLSLLLLLQLFSHSLIIRNFFVSSSSLLMLLCDSFFFYLLHSQKGIRNYHLRIKRWFETDCEQTTYIHIYTMRLSTGPGMGNRIWQKKMEKSNRKHSDEKNGMASNSSTTTPTPPHNNNNNSNNDDNAKTQYLYQIANILIDIVWRQLNMLSACVCVCVWVHITNDIEIKSCLIAFAIIRTECKRVSECMCVCVRLVMDIWINYCLT